MSPGLVTSPVIPMILETSDEELASRAAQGDNPAFEALVRRYADPLYALCRRMMADASGVEDVIQETLLKVHRSLRRFDPGRPFSPWILRIAENTCLDAMRRRKDWQPLDEDRAAEMSTASPESDPRLDGLVASLPGKYRAILHHRYALGLNSAEIATRLDLSHEDVRVCLHRALRILRARMAL